MLGSGALLGEDDDTGCITGNRGIIDISHGIYLGGWLSWKFLRAYNRGVSQLTTVAAVVIDYFAGPGGGSGASGAGLGPPWARRFGGWLGFTLGKNKSLVGFVCLSLRLRGIGTGILGSDRRSGPPSDDERKTLVRLGVTVITECKVIPEVHPKGRVLVSVAPTYHACCQVLITNGLDSRCTLSIGGVFGVHDKGGGCRRSSL